MYFVVLNMLMLILNLCEEPRVGSLNANKADKQKVNIL